LGRNELAKTSWVDSDSVVTVDQIAEVLKAFGCPAEKTPEMAKQLDKRARQLAEMKGRTYEEALTHLLKLMRDGMQGNPPNQS
jgi:hypothetical protein